MVRALDAGAELRCFHRLHARRRARDPARLLDHLFVQRAGGPSSVWLHLGLLELAGASRREGYAGAPPHTLVDNRHSILTKRTWCFIDPIGTGLPHVGGREGDEFHDYQRDLSVGEFIRPCRLAQPALGPALKYIAGRATAPRVPAA